MRPASLLRHYGSAGFLVDSNVGVDCIDAESPWHTWAVDQLRACSERADLHVNMVIYAELLSPAPTRLRSTPCWTSTERSAATCRGIARRWPPAVVNMTVLTRDEAPYRSYFPRVTRIGALTA